MAKFQPTHLTVVANTPLEKLSLLPPLVERVFLRSRISLPAHIRQAMMLRYARYKQGYQALGRIEAGKKFAFAPNKAVHTLSRNAKKLREGVFWSQQTVMSAL